MRQLALDVAALLRCLGPAPPAPPVHVVGYSLGAAVALQLAVLDATLFKTGASEAAGMKSPLNITSLQCSRRPHQLLDAWFFIPHNNI